MKLFGKKFGKKPKGPQGPKDAETKTQGGIGGRISRFVTSIASTHEIGETNENNRQNSSREQQIKMHNSAKNIAKARRDDVFSKPIDVHDNFVIPVYPKTEEQVKCIDQALGQNFIFADLSKEHRRALIDAMQREEVKEGKEIITQGDETSDFFYVVDDGRVNFIADGNDVGFCSKGGSFGELALLYNSPRAATCLAASDCVLWKVDQFTFRHLLATKQHEEEKDLISIIEKIELFKNLDTEHKNKFAEALTHVKFADGERIISLGDQGDIFYIIEDGTVKVHDIGLGDSRASGLILSAGDWFGERALLTGEPRAANVTAINDVSCLALSRETFEESIGSLSSILDRTMKKNTLKGLPLFANTEAYEIDQLVDLIQEQCYEKGHKLTEIDQPYRHDLWIIQSGRILVVNKEGALNTANTLKSGDYFDKAVKAKDGELSSDGAIAEEKTTCWVLSKSDIESVTGDTSHLGDSLKLRRMSQAPRKEIITMESLKKHRILGMGAFGRVWLVSNKKTNAPYALKVIDKEMLVTANQVPAVIREKNMMASLEHPFLLTLVSSFQDESNLYMVLDLIQGGELFSVIQNAKQGYLSNDASIFYAACVIEALGHMHDRKIAYRDLKPENCLIDAEGYCHVVDLGFAKVVTDKTYTLCGTPEYLAPEIIMSKGHNKAVDHWAYGVLIYEMITGSSPFFGAGSSQTAMFKRIVMVKYATPPWMTDSAKDMIAKLLVRSQAGRLGNLSKGNLDIKNHEWFQSIDFKKLNKKEVKAPWVPSIKNPLDSSHFDDFSHEENMPTQSEKLSAEHQALFDDF